MKLISFEDIRRLGIDPADCLNWVEEGLLNKDGAQLPPKMSLQLTGIPDGTFVNTVFCGLYRQGRCQGGFAVSPPGTGALLGDLAYGIWLMNCFSWIPGRRTALGVGFILLVSALMFVTFLLLEMARLRIDAAAKRRLASGSIARK